MGADNTDLLFAARRLMDCGTPVPGMLFREGQRVRRIQTREEGQGFLRMGFLPDLNDGVTLGAIMFELLPEGHYVKAVFPGGGRALWVVFDVQGEPVTGEAPTRAQALVAAVCGTPV